jgi:hypothetical protein
MSTATDIASIIAHVAKGGDPEEATQAALACVASARRHAEWDAYRKAARRVRGRAAALERDGHPSVASAFRLVADDVAGMAPSRRQQSPDPAHG